MTVEKIIQAVRDRGDVTLVELTSEFDGVELQKLRVPRDRLEQAWESTQGDIQEALKTASEQITAWHEMQKSEPAKLTRNGVQITEQIVPLRRAGAYIPGGRAAYPSTVLMAAIPARVAGVKELVLCSPPGSDGIPAQLTCAAAWMCGVEEVYAVGGAQAIAAMAYGTETIGSVDVVVGPGNRFVAEAKRLVSGDVRIDAIAGPSEVVVVADKSTDIKLLAFDLLAQAEHGPGGRVVAILLSQYGDELREIIDSNSADMAPISIEVVSDIEEATSRVNEIAPEHVELLVENARQIANQIVNAGVIFCNVGATFGDYIAGTNHVLPTGGTARFASGLGVDTFCRRQPVVEVANNDWQNLAIDGALIADAEGLPMHATSLRAWAGT